MIGPSYLDVVRDKCDEYWSLSMTFHDMQNEYRKVGDIDGERRAYWLGNKAGNRAIEWQRLQHHLTWYYSMSIRERNAREHVYRG